MKNVCIQGLGFVGSAMAVAVAMARDGNKPKFNVTGVELPTVNGKARMDSINKGIFPFKTSDKNLEISMERAKQQGNLKATTDPSVYSEARVIIVDIHLDISFHDDEPRLDLNPLKFAIREIARFINPETLILIETTVPPGTCEKIIAPCLHKELKERAIKQDSVYLAHSYERVMPGKDYLNSIINYPRVFSGINKKSADVCQDFLKEVLNTKRYPLTRLSSTTASETAKVLENTYRATNIAFIDEWTKYAEAVGIDLFEIINAIRVRDTHSNIMMPGLGVGGYCLTKDPTFTPAAAREIFGLNLEFPFSKLAVKTNNLMPLHTLNRLKKNLKSQNLKGKKIIIFGVTYRQDVKDSRYSASEILANHIIKEGGEILCHDPYINYWDEMDLEVLEDYPDLSDFDAVVLAVGHTEYKKKEINYWHKADLLLDANMVLSPEQINKLKRHSGKIISIGRG
jgi:nucleotide sugar dehydrogenase